MLLKTTEMNKLPESVRWHSHCQLESLEDQGNASHLISL